VVICIHDPPAPAHAGGQGKNSNSLSPASCFFHLTVSVLSTPQRTPSNCNSAPRSVASHRASMLDLSSRRPPAATSPPSYASVPAAPAALPTARQALPSAPSTSSTRAATRALSPEPSSQAHPLRLDVDLLLGELLNVLLDLRELRFVHLLPLHLADRVERGKRQARPLLVRLVNGIPLLL